jgi:hypothetical protein
MKNKCDGCGESFDDVPLAPVLIDATWLRVAAKRETLCVGCMFQRATERSVALTLADLAPCPFNVFHSPRSWYDLFLSRESEPPASLAAWRDVMMLVIA